MTDAFCPECDSKIYVGNSPKEGQKITCSQCGAYLMVASLSPIELDWAYDEDEFEYDEDFDFEEEYD
ncbi:MAG: lysine biosynthesis protein LysW [Anaerolineales bacterium]|nr:lysine biosynthesis protein LysW [Anaerolineales bacterium]